MHNPGNDEFNFRHEISISIKPGYRHGHGDTAKLKNIGHGTQHAYTYYFQLFN